MTPKKSLFNKPAWASKQLADPNGDAPIFASNAYEGIIEEQKRKQERRAAKAKERGEQLSFEDINSIGTKVENGKAFKRRKISLERKDDQQSDQSASESAEDDSRSVRSASRDSKVSSGSIQHPDTESSPRKEGRTAVVTKDVLEDVRSPNKTPEAIVLHSDEESGNNNADRDGQEDDDVIVTRAVKKKTPATKPRRKATEFDSESDADEDEYIKELKRQAREKARRKKQELDQSQSKIDLDSHQSITDILSPSATAPSPSGSTSKINQSFTGTNSIPTLPTAQDQDEDPEVQILIKTIIPNATACIVTRRASQPLDRVREFWCMRNNLDPSIASRVFFTWNGTQLYNSTTMRSILGQIRRKHGTKKDGGDLSEGKIEIEAVTQEIFDHRQKQKQRERDRLRSEDGIVLSPTPPEHDDSVAGSGPPSFIRSENQAQPHDSNGTTSATAGAPIPTEPVTNATTAAVPAPGIVIRLVADSAELEPMNLRVRPDTTMQRIARGFRRQRHLENDKRNCWLVFDGERLDDNATVQEAGFEEGDTVEVYVR